MMYRKWKLLAIILVLLLLFVFFINKVFLENKENRSILAFTSEEERVFWNDFLNASPYIGEVEDIYSMESLNDETEILKIALMADDVNTEYIDGDDIAANFMLTIGDGYKKARKEIDKYLKSLLNIESFSYNFVDTYAEEDKYIMIGKEYVYFTKINVPEKIYIAMNYKIENEEYEVEIYEYIVTEENKKQLEEMLKTGEIPSNIEKNNNYIIKGIRKENEIQITYKYKDEKDLNEVYDFFDNIPEDANIAN